jgi:hypothetical protein
MPRTEKNCPLCGALEPTNDENGMMLANVAAGDAGLAGSESLRIMDILGGYLFPKNGISVIFKILYVRNCSAMNASLANLHRQSGRTGECARNPCGAGAAGCGPAASGIRRKGASSPEKFGEGSLPVWKPCNPLKSQKTAKALFGNVWRETA